MRSIEFRGKSKYDGKWHYGYLVYEPKDKSYKVTDGRGLYYFVEDNTIGQFAGICDKNGTKIFEGDLLYYRNSNHDEEDGVMEVVFEDGAFMISGDILVPLHELYNWELEVVGNIHDNPELLGGSDDN